MATLQIGDKQVQVDDSFLKLPPDQQNATVDEIAHSMGVGGAPPPDKVSEAGDIAKSFSRGVVKGTADLAGIPGDIEHAVRSGLDYIMPLPAGAQEQGGIPAPPTSSQVENAVQDVTGKFGTPQTTAGQYAQSVGEFVPAAAGGDGRVVTKLLTALGGGVGSEAAGEATAGTGLEPYARIAGGLVGGITGATASEVPRTVAVGIQGAKDAVAPLTQAGQERLAAEKLQSAATSPAAAADAIDNAPAQIVPGSQPTTFQQTGDMGLGGLEREAQTKNAPAFIERAATQNAAQVGALKGIQEEGAPEQVAQAFRRRLDQIDQDTQAAVDSATQKASDASSIMSGTIGERTTGLGQAAAASSDAATAGAQGAAQAVGLGLEPEAAGAAIRSGLEDARAQAKTQERQLWNAVDPDGTLALAPAQTKHMATTIAADMPVSAGPMGAAESAIHDVIAQYGDAVPLREMSALRTRIGEAISTEKTANNGIETSLSRRLGMLYHAIGDDLQNAVAAKVENESQQVARGKLDPAKTYAANLQKQVDAWNQQRQSAARRAPAQDAGNVGTAATASMRPGFGSQGAPRSGLPNATSDSGLSADAANFDQAALDRLNAARTATAQRAATFDNKTLGPIRARPSGSAPYNMPAAGVAARVFVPGPKGFETLQTYRQAVTDPAAMDAVQQYAIDRLNTAAARPDGTLDPAKAMAFQRRYSDALRAFPQLNQRIDAAVTASNAAADAATQTAATTKLTAKMAQAATLPDGTLDPAKLDAWRQKNSAALAQFPDLASQFKDVDSASAALAAASAARKTALDGAQKGALGKLIGVTAPEDVTKTVGGLFSRQDAVQQFTNLKTAIGTDADAQQGLRKAIVDYMTGRFVGNTEAATSGLGTIKSDSLQTFVRQNQAALKAAGFSDEEIGTMNAVAADLQRANRSNTSVKLPARSNTAQDSVSLLRQIAQATRSHTGMTVEGAGIGGALGSVFGPIGGALGAAAGAGAGRAFATARQAGLDSVDKIVADAMLNPGRAKVLLRTPLTPKAQMRSWSDLASMYSRATLTGISAASQVRSGNQ